METKILRKLAKRGNLCRRENGVWTEMAHISMEELLKILKEVVENVKIGPCYRPPQEAKVAQIFGDCDI